MLTPPNQLNRKFRYLFFFLNPSLIHFRTLFSTSNTFFMGKFLCPISHLLFIQTYTIFFQFCTSLYKQFLPNLAPKFAKIVPFSPNSHLFSPNSHLSCLVSHLSFGGPPKGKELVLSGWWMTVTVLGSWPQSTLSSVTHQRVRSCW